MRAALERLWQGPAAALGLLTCLPVPRGAGLGLVHAAGWFPAVGALLGLLLAAVAAALPEGMAPELGATLLVALLAALTGGLHLDGLADVADGLAGGRRDRARILAIMRDPRIGACGAAALFLHLAGKLFAVAELLRQGSPWPLIVAPAVARASAVLLMVAFPCARAQGLGHAVAGSTQSRDVAVAAALALSTLALAGREALAPALAAGACALSCGAVLTRRLGGLTGDAYGAAIELAELGYWVVAGALGPELYGRAA